MERLKTKLRALNLINKKRKAIERGSLSEIVNQKKPSLGPHKSHPVGSAEPYRKCRRTNHTSLECRVGTKNCMWCGSLEHLIAICPRRLKAVDKGAAKPLASPRQGALPPRLAAIGQVYVMSKKEAATPSALVTRALSLNSKPFCVLFYSGAAYSFIST